MLDYIKRINSELIFPVNIYEPCFYDHLIDINNIPLFNDLKNNHQTIKTELFNNFEYINYDGFFYNDLEKAVFSKDDKKTLKESIFGYSLFFTNPYENQNNFNLIKKNSHVTFSIIDKLYKDKIILSFSISRLKPLSYIIPHNDRLYNNTLRVHYCLENDSNCYITVKDEIRNWKEGEFLIFDPSNYRHKVDHHGDKDRTIIIMDIKKEYLRKFYK